jgi:hypothetical protein
MTGIFKPWLLSGRASVPVVVLFIGLLGFFVLGIYKAVYRRCYISPGYTFFMIWLDVSEI